jgi:uncharacterized membrane protein YfcA
LPGIEINLYLFVFTGLGAGIISGFTGVGGGFLMTPALIVLGFPANLAVGTSLTWVFGNCIIGGFRHGRLGNLDIRLGLVMVAAAMAGMEVGVRVLNWAESIGLADAGVLSIALGMLVVVGSYTLVESIGKKRQLDRALRQEETLATETPPLAERLQRISFPPMIRFSRAQVTISLWVMLVIGFCVGVLAGIVGVGGGFITVPSLIYLVGVPSFVAVGTSLFQTACSAAYGTVRHSMSGNVIIFASFIMLVASSIGVQFGVLTTRYVRAVSVRYILGICILLAACGTALKLCGVLLGEKAAWAGTGSLITTFGGLGLGVMMIVALLVIAVRHRKGGNIPSWARSLMSDTAG